MPARKNQAHRRQKRAVARVRRIQIQIPVAIDVAQGGDHHARARSQCGLEQGGMKRFNLSTVRRRTFRKYGDIFTRGQGLDDGAVGTHRVVPFTAFDKDGSSTRHQESDYRPAPNIRLRHEAHRDHRVDDPDIQPRDMVAHDQRGNMSARSGAMYEDLQAEHMQDLLRPPLDRAKALPAREKGKQSAYVKATVEQMEQDSGEAVKPNVAWGRPVPCGLAGPLATVTIRHSS
jgi:hypothetical protein